MSNKLRNFLANAIKQNGRSSWSLDPVVLSSARPGWAEIDNCDFLVLCSNDYLGLACDPRVIEAGQRALKQYGAGSRGARQVIGDTNLHRQLEAELAEFKGVEASLLFNSGSTSNRAILSSLMQAGDLVCIDELNHTSVIDGCQLSEAKVATYQHRDIDDLAKILEDAPRGGKTIVVTATVFGMTGTIAPLAKIVELAAQYGAFVMVDDAHATGVLGRRGEGLAAQLGVHKQVDIHMGTLGKALGSIGGYIAGDQVLIDYLAGYAHPFRSSTSLPPSAVASALEALRILRAEPERVEKLWSNARRFHTGIKSLCFQVHSAAAPITPIFFKDGEMAAQVRRFLLERNILVQLADVSYIEPGTSCLRTIVSASHTEGDIDFALAMFKLVGENFAIPDRIQSNRSDSRAAQLGR